MLYDFGLLTKMSYKCNISMIIDYSLIFSCEYSVGLGATAATVWKGSALNCPSTNNEIILLHNRVNSTSSCNDDNIVAWLVVNGSSIVISKARIINVTTELNGKSIVCFHDNGYEEKLIKNFTIDLGNFYNSAIKMHIIKFIPCMRLRRYIAS